MNQELGQRLGYAPGYKSPLRVPYRETSPFGQRTHPILGRKMPHTGIDLATGPVDPNSHGPPVYATAPGTILKMGEDSINGKYIKIRHDDGRESSYVHLSGFGPVREGQRIEDPTNEIGYLGSTGRATGPHLHFGMKENGQFIDPTMALRGEPPRMSATTSGPDLSALAAALADPSMNERYTASGPANAQVASMRPDAQMAGPGMELPPDILGRLDPRALAARLR